jgi:hypothetical protein
MNTQEAVRVGVYTCGGGGGEEWGGGEGMEHKGTLSSARPLTPHSRLAGSWRSSSGRRACIQ